MSNPIKTKSRENITEQLSTIESQTDKRGGPIKRCLNQARGLCHPSKTNFLRNLSSKSTFALLCILLVLVGIGPLVLLLGIGNWFFALNCVWLDHCHVTVIGGLTKNLHAWEPDQVKIVRYGYMHIWIYGQLYVHTHMWRLMWICAPFIWISFMIVDMFVDTYLCCH